MMLIRGLSACITPTHPHTVEKLTVLCVCVYDNECLVCVWRGGG